MRYLVLGGGGFIGSALVDRLLADRYCVRVFERTRIIPYRKFLSHENIEWQTGDFQSKADIEEATESCDVIIHLISTTLPKNSSSDPIYDVESNLVSTLELLTCAVRRGTKKIVFISSGGTVYGIPRQVPIPETHPMNPVVPYAITKLAIEKYLYYFRTVHGLEYSVLRVANPFGGRQRLGTGQGAVATFISKAIVDEPIEIWGDGSVTRDYIYIDDVVDAFIRSIEYSGEHRVFNIGSGCGRSLNEVISAIESLIGRPVRRSYLPARPFDVPINILDISRAQTCLGWNPQVSFHEGLKRTILWIRRNMGADNQ
jgi:UDP-glucose 4-epimerase